MEFRLDEGQVELQQTVARFCADRFPLDAVVAREGRPTDRRLWAEMAELGIFGLLRPEGAGGSGLGAIDAAIVYEQLGSHLAPGPVLWTILAAPLVEGAATGDVRVGGVLEPDLVDGVALVEHAAEIDVLLVVGDDGVVAHEVAALPPPLPLDPLDPLTPVARMSALSAPTALAADAADAGAARAGRSPAARLAGDAAAAGELRLLGTVLAAAMAAGVAQRALHVARGYALERRQFDVPIGSFQAVKHLLADMFVRSGLAQSAAYAAAAVLQEPGADDPARAAAGAKLLAAEAALANASTAVQVLGGMGFTWDMLPNHLLKRAWVLEHAFGEADVHAAALGAQLVDAHR